MKIKFLLILLCGFILSGSVSCKKIKKTDAEIEREQWISGFTDSIDYYQQRTKEIDLRLQDVNGRIAELIGRFEMIKKPREVSGYYLLKGWESKLPLTTTGIYARINENEKLELIATLAGATFNQIAVGDNKADFYSEVVPNDQAFNFRHDRFNTVYFSGGKADTIAEYIALHNSNKIHLFFNEGKVKKNFIIPDNEKNMISQTWNLFAAQKEAHQLQRELWICSKKIETFRRIMDTENKLEN